MIRNGQSVNIEILIYVASYLILCPNLIGQRPFSNNFKNNSKMHRKSWTQQEDIALRNIVEEIGLTNWTLVAAKLSNQVVDSCRAGKQCRQRWINHLDLAVCKKSWSKMEDKMLFQLHSVHGNRWKQLAKQLKERTQNDIKNHFYSSMRKGVRRLNRFFGFPQDALKIRKIKPIIMSKICDEYSHDEKTSMKQQTQSVFDLILKLSRCDSDIEKCDQYIDDEKLMKQAQDFLALLIKQNQQYEQKKKEKAPKKQCPSSPIACSIHPKSEPNQLDISEYLCLQIKMPKNRQCNNNNKTKSEGGKYQINSDGSIFQCIDDKEESDYGDDGEGSGDDGEGE